ncbi:MAG: site-specific integrase [SAR324 cluster bacterium]|nr:site-specific integrase [SAR324 cluster bacterium]
MPKPRQKTTYNKTRKVWVGQFYLEGKKRAIRRDLCTLEEYAYKETARGQKKRSELEMKTFLDKQYAKIELEITEKANKDKYDKEARAHLGLPIKEVMQVWLDEVKEFRSPATYRAYLIAANYYQEVLGNHHIGEFNSDHNLSLSELLTAKGMNANSRRKYLSYIQTFYIWAEKNSYCKPVKIAKPQRVTKEPRIYSRRDLTVILKALHEVHEAATNKRRKRARWNQIRAFILMVNTAMRAGEVCNLRLEHIDIEQRLIHIWATDDWKPKGGREATIPMSEDLAGFLASDQREKGEQWFLDEGDGTKAYASSTGLGNATRKLNKKLGFKGVKPWHGIRASVVTHLLESGRDITFVQKLARHKDIATTKGYLNSEKLPLKDMVDGIKLLD